jgi:hypothetical protein
MADTAKKGQGLSLNAIIVATLALLVLVVLAMIFTGRIGNFTKEARSCSTLGSAGCVTDSSECSGEGQKVMNRYSCPEESPVCCLDITAEKDIELS